MIVVFYEDLEAVQQTLADLGAVRGTDSWSRSGSRKTAHWAR